MKKLLPLFVFALSVLSSCNGQNTNQQVTIDKTATPYQTLNSPTPVALPQPKKEDTKPLAKSEEAKPLINFFAFVNKSSAEIEKTFGKPSLVDTKYVQSKDGEFRHYDKFGKGLLQVDYYKGKAVAFYFDIPESERSQSLEQTLKLCGLELNVSEAQRTTLGFWWNNPPAPFYRAEVSKFDDSGLYYNCQAHIKLTN